MFSKLNRATRMIIPQLEWLEDRRLLSGGISLPVNALAVLLSPIEIAAALHGATNALSGHAGISNNGQTGLAVDVGLDAHTPIGAGTNLGVNAQTANATVFNLGLKSVISAPLLGTSGMGTFVGLNAGLPNAGLRTTFGVSGSGISSIGGSVNLTGSQAGNPGPSVTIDLQTDTWGPFDFGNSLDLATGGTNNSSRLSSPGESAVGLTSLPGLGDAAAVDLLLKGPGSFGLVAPGDALKDSAGFDQAARSPAIGTEDETVLTGNEGETVSPQWEDLRENHSTDLGSLTVFFHRIFSQVGDLGRDSFKWFTHLGWSAWIIGLAIAATVGAVLRQKLRRAREKPALRAGSGPSLETWLLSGPK
jgi:hypothetical protein